ncbi:MAG: flagellar hook protein FlgE [Actinobacteria bacterium]|nr:flagellar hook protein FlgE [Actinomycetota bacterium]
MLRSMFAAVSGLRAHQTMMDVVGNNIANVNTTGFKSSRATFQEALNQTLRGASGTGPATAGTNAMQIGLGSQIASIDGVFTQGSTQMTGRTGDLAIQGEGFFVVGQGNERSYTRAGGFGFDESGYLATPGGARLQGWMADQATGAINTNGAITAIQLPMGQTIAPKATDRVELLGNLPADASAGDAAATPPVPADVFNTSITVYDSKGEPHDIAISMTKDAADNTWSFQPSVNGTDVGAAQTVTFNADGTLNGPGSFTLEGVDFGNGSATDQDITIDLGGLVQFGGSATAEARSQTGSAMGFLRSFEFGADGTVTGRFSNGQTKLLGMVAIATFNNPAGLVREGESLFTVSANSGEPIVGRPGAGDAGSLAPGSLEMSNVDLAQEFTNLIIAQRGFQANSRGITASDELLQELVNLKR